MPVLRETSDCHDDATDEEEEEEEEEEVAGSIFARAYSTVY
jgi:hypothetical protein